MTQWYKLTNIDIFHNWINKLFSEESKVPRTLFETRKWRGPPNINKIEQYEIMLSFVYSVYSAMKTKLVCIFSSSRHKENSRWRHFSSNKMYFLKLHSAPLKDNTITLFVCGGPCHLFSSKHCSGGLIFLKFWVCISSLKLNPHSSSLKYIHTSSANLHHLQVKGRKWVLNGCHGCPAV